MQHNYRRNNRGEKNGTLFKGLILHHMDYVFQVTWSLLF